MSLFPILLVIAFSFKCRQVWHFSKYDEVHLFAGSPVFQTAGGSVSRSNSLCLVIAEMKALVALPASG